MDYTHNTSTCLVGYNRELLPEKRPKKSQDAPPSPPPKMDFSVSQYTGQFEDQPPSNNDKENYKMIIHENYVVRLPERLARRVEENKRREAAGGDRGRGRGRGGFRGGRGGGSRGRGGMDRNR